MNVQGVRRNLKNVVNNYSDAQVKVREATSNDPWGPSSTLMSEVADLTYNIVALSEIMQLVWKRLNDHGKNWRHVYKALVLLEYLIKTGSERVAQQCKENIFAIQTLKDFQYVEDNKDQGINVREKAKQLVSLLKDDERLRNERARALKAKERLAQSTAGIGSDPEDARPDTFGSSDSIASPSNVDLESARPQTAGEEELQLQLALAMSKEEADQEEKVRRGDDVRLQMAISESRDGREVPSTIKPPSSVDLLAINLSPSSNGAVAPVPNADPWGVSLSQQENDPWIPPPKPQQEGTNDPWSLPSVPNPNSSNVNVPFQSPDDPWPAPVNLPASSSDPWSSVPSSTTIGGARNNGDTDGFDLLSNSRNNSFVEGIIEESNKASTGTASPNPFDIESLSRSLTTSTNNSPQKKSAENFLGANSSLVNLDALVSSAPKTNVEPVLVISDDGNRSRASSSLATDPTNPFAFSSAAAIANPFQATRPQPPSMNQLRASQSQQFAPTFTSTSSLAYPATQNTTLSNPTMNAGLVPTHQQNNNPFL